MKTSVLLTALLTLTVPVVGLRAADEKAHSHEDHTELGEHMEKIGGANRRLSRQIADASKNEESLKLVATMKKEAQASLKLQPEKTADLPAEQRAKFLAEYEKHMHAFLAELDKLEAALKAGKNDEAAAIAKGFKPMMDDSHKEFRKPKPKKEKKNG